MFQSSARLSSAILLIGFFLIQCSKEKDEKPGATLTEAILGLASGRQSGGTTEPPKPAEEGPVTIVPGIAGPGDPVNAPALGNPTIATANANPVDDPYGFQGMYFVSGITFNLPVHNQTAVTAFIGSRAMVRNPDGSVVHSYAHYTVSPAVAQAVGFQFLQQADIKLKVLIVAQNEFGVSTKEINVSHARFCAGAPVAPATVGNCGDYCVQGSVTGNSMDLKATYNLGSTDYLYLDVGAESPRGTGFSLGSHTVEFGADTPNATPGVYNSISSLDLTAEPAFICVIAESTVVQGSSLRILRGKIRNE